MKTTLTYIFLVVRQKKAIVFSIVVSITLLTLLYSIFAPHSYRYVITLMPPEQKAPSGLSSILQNVMPSLPMGGLGGNSGQFTSADVLASNSVIDELLNYKEISNSPVFTSKNRNEKLFIIKNAIAVDNRKSGVTGIIITLPTSFNPSEEMVNDNHKLLQNIAQRLPEAVDKVLHSKSASTAKKTRIFIERVISKHKKELDSVQKLVQDFQQKNHVIGIDAQTSAMVNNAAALSTDLAKAEIEISMAEQEYAPSSPAVIALRQQIETINQQLERAQTGGLVSFDKTSIRVDSIPSLTKQYVNLLRSQKILEQITVYLETQRLQEFIQEEKDVPSVQVLDGVYGAPEKISPKPFVMTFLAFVVSTTLAIAWVIIGVLKK